MDISEAQKKLQPVSITIRKLVAACSDDFEPQHDMPDLEYQGLRRMLEVVEAELQEQLGVDNNGVGESSRIYAFRYEMGLRAILLADAKRTGEAPTESYMEETDSLVKFRFEAIYEAKYFSPVPLSDEMVSQFGQRNVPHNLWPFWRECVHNTSMRMGFKVPVVVPLLQPVHSSSK